MLGEIISAGANLLGGILGQNDKKKDRELQKDFAQQGIQWKVADAKAAGLHPLAALGAQTTSYAPVSVGGPSIASGVASAGQDISRAVDATRTSGQKLDAYGKTIQDLNVQRMGLENQLLSSQIAKVNQAGNPPPMPAATDRYLLEGQANSGLKPLVTDQALERVVGNPGQPSTEAGAVTDMGYARTRSGWAPVMSKDFQERSEEDFLGGLAWNMRNRLAPSFGSGSNPPVNVPRDAGEYWIYNPIMQEYQLVKPRTSRSPYGFDRYYR
ncbi:DNA pilot protein [robinz microvirus RP_172]|nr:DNA pilot protein [robinz microvirus RP_172]